MEGHSSYRVARLELKTPGRAQYCSEIQAATPNNLYTKTAEQGG